MSRHGRALVAVLAAAGMTACASPSRATVPATLEDRARAIHARVLTLDTHVDIEPAFFQPVAPNYVTGLTTQVDLPKMARGGLKAAFFSIFQDQEPDLTPAGYARAYAVAVAKIEGVQRLTGELAPERIALARTADQMRRIHAEGKLVALLGMENGYAIGEDINNVRTFAAMGVRYLSLAHNEHNQLADSNTGEREGYRWNGLSPLGRAVVAEANRWGILLDISHPSKDANLQTMRLSQAPVMASHSCARALANHARNLDDEELRALKKNGGVVHVTAYAGFLKTEPAAQQAASAALRQEFGLPAAGGRSRTQAVLDRLPPERRAEYERRVQQIDAGFPPPTPANVQDLVNHIDYIVKVIGIDHVGISSDFDGGGGIDGWRDAGETFNVTLELVRRGYSEREIAKIWSGNAMRVLAEADEVAARLQRERR